MDEKRRRREKRVRRKQMAVKKEKMRRQVEASEYLMQLKQEEADWHLRQLSVQAMGVDVRESHPACWGHMDRTVKPRVAEVHPACWPPPAGGIASQPRRKVSSTGYVSDASRKRVGRDKPPDINLDFRVSRCPVCRSPPTLTVPGCPACWQNISNLPFTPNRNAPSTGNALRQRPGYIGGLDGGDLVGGLAGRSIGGGPGGFGGGVGGVSRGGVGSAGSRMSSRDGTGSARIGGGGVLSAGEFRGGPMIPPNIMVPPRLIRPEADGGCGGARIQKPLVGTVPVARALRPAGTGRMVNRTMVRRQRYDTCQYMDIFVKRCPSGEVVKCKLLMGSTVHYVYFIVQSNTPVDLSSAITELGVQTTLIVPTESGLFVLEQSDDHNAPFSWQGYHGHYAPRTLSDYNINQHDCQVNLLEVLSLNPRRTPLMLRKFMSANFAVNSDRFSTEIRWYLEDLPAGLPGRDEVQEQMSGVIGDIQRLKVHLTEGEEHEQRQQKRYQLGIAADRFRAARLKDKRRAGLTSKVEAKIEQDHEQSEHAQALVNMQMAMGQLSVPPLQLDPPSATRRAAPPKAFLKKMNKAANEAFDKKADHTFEDQLTMPDDCEEWRERLIRRMFRKMRDEYVTIGQSRVTPKLVKTLMKRARAIGVRTRKKGVMAEDQAYRLEAALHIAEAEGAVARDPEIVREEELSALGAHHIGLSTMPSKRRGAAHHIGPKSSFMIRQSKDGPTSVIGFLPTGDVDNGVA